MIIEEIQVNEVSLAANPKNKKRFICIKDTKGGILMDKFLKLMAFLATKSANVPVVVQEELKTVDKDVSSEDILDIFKDQLAGYTISKTMDGVKLVDTNKFDIVEKAKVADIPDAVKKQMEAQNKEIRELKLDKFNSTVATKVGDAILPVISPLYEKLSDADLGKVLDVIKFQQDIINELGKGQLSKEIPTTGKDLEAKVADYAKANNMKESDAWAAYAKEHPAEFSEGV